MINLLATQPQLMLHVEKNYTFLISCKYILSIIKDVLQQILAKGLEI